MHFLIPDDAGLPIDEPVVCKGYAGNTIAVRVAVHGRGHRKFAKDAPAFCSAADAGADICPTVDKASFADAVSKYMTEREPVWWKPGVWSYDCGDTPSMEGLILQVPFTRAMVRHAFDAVLRLLTEWDLGEDFAIYFTPMSGVAVDVRSDPPREK